jgi:hypothetical protein
MMLLINKERHSQPESCVTISRMAETVGQYHLYVICNI